MSRKRPQTISPFHHLTLLNALNVTNTIFCGVVLLPSYMALRNHLAWLCPMGRLFSGQDSFGYFAHAAEAGLIFFFFRVVCLAVFAYDVCACLFILRGGQAVFDVRIKQAR